METVKRCTKCGVHKSLSEFRKDSRNKSGIGAWCKKCSHTAHKEWCAKNKEKVTATQEKCRKNQTKKTRPMTVREWQEANIGRVKATQKKWKLNNLEKIRETNKKWREANIEKVREHGRISNVKRRAIPKGRINNNISTQIRTSLKKGAKANRHWEELVDFTVDQLKKHLEKRFAPEMTWDNYGSYWHIDHKIPVAVLNFDRPEDIDFRLCWSLKNLQPLEAKENIRKGARLEKHFQPALLLAI